VPPIAMTVGKRAAESQQFGRLACYAAERRRKSVVERGRRRGVAFIGPFRYIRMGIAKRMQEEADERHAAPRPGA
jgi:hypothetical protein